MADYWKSQPRKFCEFCKCWISDNKASRDFHENGKRHKESVKNRIDEIRKKSIQDEKNQKEASGFLAEMEKAAMLKLREDLASDPTLAAQYGVTIKSKQEADSTAAASSTLATAAASSSTALNSDTTAAGVWQEAYSPEGYIYYWNSLTNESRWELPADAVKTDDEKQQKLNTTETASSHKQTPENTSTAAGNSKPEANSEEASQKKSNEISSTKIKKPAFKMIAKVSKPESCSNPVESSSEKKANEPKPDEKSGLQNTVGKTSNSKSPYGAWTAVAPVEESPLDYQLPCTTQPELLNIELPDEAEQVKKMKFSEKTVTSLGNGANQPAEGFKKRKLNSGGVRNIRRAQDEES